MRIVYVPPNEKAIEKNIENSLESLKKQIGGYIQSGYYFKAHRIVALFDEEGKNKKLLYNIYLVSPRGKVLDVLVGPVIFCYQNGEEFDSLPEDVAQYLLKKFGGETHVIAIPG